MIIRLFGPEPETEDRSIFFYFAKFFAKGLANILDGSDWGLDWGADWGVSLAGEGADGEDGGEDGLVWAGLSEKEEKAPTLSFFLTTTATFLPIGRVSLLSAITLARTPFSVA